MSNDKDNQILIEDDFFLPFYGKLNKENRWIVMSQLIPWEKFQDKYSANFKEGNGTVPFSVRVALGTLIIKEIEGFSDRATVSHISENPFMQYFLGFSGFNQEEPFDASLITHFRHRLGAEIINEVNEMISIEAAKKAIDCENKKNKKNKKNDKNPPSDVSGNSTGEGTASAPENQGNLLLDATCAPADIKYPTDLNLLNEAREKLEEMIDELHSPNAGKKSKPRTYRNKARKEFLRVTKQRRVKSAVMRKAIAKQLGYVSRNLKSVNKLLEENGFENLSNKKLQELWVITELFRQQKLMYDSKTHSVDDRIVSISQPHVRPIVRGKANAATEFGAKVAISVVNGYAFIDELSWDAFNEGAKLKDSVEEYHRRFGFYPKAVIADKLYRNRENLNYLNALGIRLTGPKLGRPTELASKEQKILERQDASIRNEVEGKFGEGKRRYGLGRIMAKLDNTGRTVVAMQFLVMNLRKRVGLIFYLIYRWLFYRLQSQLSAPA